MRRPSPNVALIPSAKDGKLAMNLVIEEGLPQGLKRSLFTAVNKRFHALVKGARPDPIKATPFQKSIESVNFEVIQVAAIPKSYLYDMLGLALDMIEEARDRGWLFFDEERRQWEYDKKGEVIHVDFGRVGGKGQDTDGQ